jgi:ornithine cyclodeaminase
VQSLSSGTIFKRTHGNYALVAALAFSTRTGCLEQSDQGSGTASRITVRDKAEDLIRSSDPVVFATIASSYTSAKFRGSSTIPLVLHVSLRDLTPDILLASANVVDRAEHCLKASTSPHLAEQLTGNRDFLPGTLDD